MTPAQMLRVHATALGFLVVLLKDVPEEKQASRAKAIGRLIESFCWVTVPDSLGTSNENIVDESDPTIIDASIEKYKAQLIGEESAPLPEGREALLRFYDRLAIRAHRRLEKKFYEMGHEDIIANRILELAEAEIADEGADA
jgi:hypothetical protein